MANQNDQKSAARAKREQAQQAAEAAAKRNRNLQILGGVLFAAVLVVVLVVVFSGGKDSDSSGIGGDDSAEVAGVEETRALFNGIEQRGLTLGDPDAPVTLIEFVDVQCPFCRDSFDRELPTIVDELVRTGEVKVRLAPLALQMMGEDSVAGRAVILRLADEGKAWDFTNLFYLNQGTEGTGYVTDEYLRKLVTAAGADPALASPRTPDAEDEETIEELEQLASDLNVSGTPSYAIGRSGTEPSTYDLVEVGADASVAEQIAAQAEEIAGT